MNRYSLTYMSCVWEGVPLLENPTWHRSHEERKHDMMQQNAVDVDRLFWTRQNLRVGTANLHSKVRAY